LLESLALGIATLLLFLYGYAQRHLRKKTLEKIETERLSAENKLYESEQASLENLQRTQRDREAAEAELKNLRKACSDFAREREDLMKEVARLQGQKKALVNFMKTEDGRVKLKEAEEKLALLNKEILARKSGRVVCRFSYSGKASCKNAYEAILEECQNVWKIHPDLVLSMHTKGVSKSHWFSEWEGSSPTSFRAQIKAKENHTWIEDGHCELRVL
jgi:hypothetical protein